METGNRKPKIVVVCGPTASGKTAAAVALAEVFGGEIIGADSMQVYRTMDIGTAKPTPEECARVPHHMIDIVDPDEPFDAERYTVMAREADAEIRSRDLNPVVAGGTGLYIKAFIHGLFQQPPVDRRIKDRLKSEAETLGIHALHDRLVRLDPETAARTHPNDAYRILRALEVIEASGHPLSEYHSVHRFRDRPFDVFKIGLHLDRETLYERINRRAEAMVDNGLLQEVSRLLDRGYPADLKSMQSLGYRHMAAYLQGRSTLDEAVRTLKRDTRRYAKRQMTWFRADTDIVWINPENIRDTYRSIRSFFQSPA